MVLYLLKFQESTAISTLATNGTHLYWNRKFVDSITVYELMAGICHEVLHCILMHMDRFGLDRIHKWWNIACDLVINHMLRIQGFILPEGALFEYNSVHGAKKSSEAVYDELMQKNQPDPNDQPDPKSKPDPDDQAVCAGDILEPGKDDEGNPIDDAPTYIEQRNSWEQAIEAATEQAEKAGQLPGGIKELVAAILKPKVNWVAVTRRWMVKDPHVKNYSKFIKRWVPHGMYLPKRSKKRLGNGVVILDSSGSVTTEAAKEFTSEMSHILRALNPEKIHFFCCDTQVHEPRTYTQNDLPLKEVAIYGRGGTKLQPAFDYIDSLHEKPNWCIYFTDLDSIDTPTEPNYPVLWICNDKRRNAPFGKIAYI